MSNFTLQVVERPPVDSLVAILSAPGLRFIAQPLSRHTRDRTVDVLSPCCGGYLQSRKFKPASPVGTFECVMCSSDIALPLKALSFRINPWTVEHAFVMGDGEAEKLELLFADHTDPLTAKIMASELEDLLTRLFQRVEARLWADLKDPRASLSLKEGTKLLREVVAGG